MNDIFNSDNSEDDDNFLLSENPNLKNNNK